MFIFGIIKLRVICLYNVSTEFSVKTTKIKPEKKNIIQLPTDLNASDLIIRCM